MFLLNTGVSRYNSNTIPVCKHQAVKVYRGSVWKAPQILNLGIKLR
jgi:hypothetical protein